MEPLTDRIAAIRQFNRFYTQRIGVLQDGFADSPFSLTQARVLYEIVHRDQPTASEIGAELGLDAGYLSRMLRDLARRGLIAKERSRVDGRQVHLTITPRGHKAFAPLEAHSQTEVGTMLRSLAADDQSRLVVAMQTVRQLLIGAPKGEDYVLRPHQPGDMGWIVSRHGTLYVEEQGWDHRLEAVAAEIVATFLRRFDPERERCWIAERDGERLGCVMLVRQTARVARLRLLLVEPSARGLGIGKRLVDECIAFARAAGYRKITLWTHTVLAAARRIYQGAGFRLVKTWHHDEFGKMLESESWELKL